MSPQDIQELLSKNKLCIGMTDEQIGKLFLESEIKEFKPSDVIIQEGSKGDTFYIIIQGQVEIIKKAKDRRDKQDYHIATLDQNDIIGELALVDNRPRSATVRAVTPTKVLAINVNKIKGDPNLDAVIATNIGHELSLRLRHTTDVTVESLRAKLNLSKARNAMGAFMVYTLSLIAIYTILLSLLTLLSKYFHNTTAISIIVLIMFAVGIMMVMKQSQYPLSTYGLTLKNWKRSCIEAVIFSLPLIGIILLAKWITISVTPSFANVKLIDPFQASTDHALSWSIYIGTLFAYSFFVPIQELIVRGGIQSSLYLFLTGTERKRRWQSIIIANLLFTMTHAHTSFGFLMVVFIPGIFWGWLYDRHKTLIGVTLSHMLIGIFAVFIMGFERLFT